MSAEYTPTPWSYVVSEGQPQIIKTSDCGRYAQEICEIYGHGSEVDDDANAEFIVRCVNAHDDLVAALRECAKWIGWLRDGEVRDIPWAAMGWEELIVNALAKAEARS